MSNDRCSCAPAKPTKVSELLGDRIAVLLMIADNVCPRDVNNLIADADEAAQKARSGEE